MKYFGSKMGQVGPSWSQLEAKMEPRRAKLELKCAQKPSKNHLRIDAESNPQKSLKKFEKIEKGNKVRSQGNKVSVGWAAGADPEEDKSL